MLLRAEDPDSDWECRLQDFLDAPNFRLGRMNVGSEKEYADLYAQFKSAFRPTEQMLDQLYEADYMRAFYSPEERESLRARWKGTSSR